MHWRIRCTRRWIGFDAVDGLMRSFREAELMLDDSLQPAGVSVVGVPTTGVAASGVAAAGEIRLAGVLPPEGTPTGKISVLSSRFFFGFGSGAVRYRQFPSYETKQRL